MLFNLFEFFSSLKERCFLEVRQSCGNEEANSDWSRPITGATLVAGDCADPAQQATQLAAAISTPTAATPETCCEYRSTFNMYILYK